MEQPDASLQLILPTDKRNPGFKPARRNGD